MEWSQGILDVGQGYLLEAFYTQEHRQYFYQLIIDKGKLFFFLITFYRLGIGYEIDEKYSNISKQFLCEKFDDPSLFEIININIEFFNQDPKKKIFDLVIMNPPFGTKKEGIDVIFIQKAMKVSLFC